MIYLWLALEEHVKNCRKTVEGSVNALLVKDNAGAIITAEDTQTLRETNLKRHEA